MLELPYLTQMWSEWRYKFSPLPFLKQSEVHLSGLRGCEQQAREMARGGHGRQDTRQSHLVPTHPHFTDVYAVEVSGTFRHKQLNLIY